MSAHARMVGSHVNLGGFLRDHCGSLKEAFNLLDLRSTGQLSREPFVAGLKRLGYKGETEGFFEEMDTRGVGTITLREFIVHFTTRITPQVPRQSSPSGLQDDTGSTGGRQPPFNGMDDFARIALVEDVESRARDSIDTLRQEVKEMLESVRQEVSTVQAQHQTNHLMLLQAMHTRPMTSDVEKLVRNEVDRSVQEVSVKLEEEVSNVGRMMKTEVDQAIARSTMELEGKFSGPIVPSAEANEGNEGGNTVSVSQLAQLETELSKYCTSLFGEFQAQFESETAKLNGIVTSGETTVREVSTNIQTTLELQTKLDNEMAKLQNRMLETENQMMELSDDEALQKRCIPFFEDKVEAPIIAQDAMNLATDTKGSIDILGQQFAKLEENVSLGNQKHEVFAERVMNGLQGLLFTIDTSTALETPKQLHTPKLQSSASTTCIRSKPPSHSSMSGSSVVTDANMCWKSIGAAMAKPDIVTVPMHPGTRMSTMSFMAGGEASPPAPLKYTRASAVHGAIQALQQDLMNFHSVSGSAAQGAPGSPDKDVSIDRSMDADTFAYRMSFSPGAPTPVLRSRSLGNEQPGRASSPGVPNAQATIQTLTGPVLSSTASSARLSSPNRLTSGGGTNRMLTPKTVGVCSVTRARSPQASPSTMMRPLTPPRGGATAMAHSRSRTGLVDKGRVTPMTPAVPVATVVGTCGGGPGSAKLPSYVAAPTQAWQQLSAIPDQLIQASPILGRRSQTPPRQAPPTTASRHAPTGQAAQSAMRQPSFTHKAS